MAVIVNKNDVTNYGEQIIEYSEEFSSEIRKFSELIDSINKAWDGADALKFVNTMKEKYVVKLEELKSVLDDYGKYLKDVSETYTVVDEIFSSKVIDV